MAHAKGFRVHMRYIGVSDDESVKRVTYWVEGRGHAASENTLRDIHRSSMKNLPLACQERAIEFVRLFDNSEFGDKPRLVLELRRGHPLYVANPAPNWLEAAFANTLIPYPNFASSGSGPALAALAEERELGVWKRPCRSAVARPWLRRLLSATPAFFDRRISASPIA